MERKYWNRWLQEDPDHRGIARQAIDMILTWNSLHTVPDPGVELSQLEEAIDGYERRRGRLANRCDRSFYRKHRSLVAAGILLLIALIASLFAYQFNPDKSAKPELARATSVQEYSTGCGEKLTFRLSDGSRIMLNGNSNLRFSSKIEKGLNTEVWLKGEAYFDIVHLEGDLKRTFTVHTDDGSIQVLGTRFSVNTFRQKTQTVLEEGEIRIRVKGRSADASAEYLLKPGEVAHFLANDNKIAIKEANPRIYTSWTKNKLFFDHTPMDEVARRIEDIYGVTVVLSGWLEGETVSGSIKNDNLQVLAEALSEVLNASVSQEGRTLRIGSNE